MEGSSLVGTRKFKDGADRIEILDAIIEQIYQQSIFSKRELKVLLEEWATKGYAYVPTDEELIMLICGDL